MSFFRKNIFGDNIESSEFLNAGDALWYKSFDGRIPPEEQEALQKKALDEYRNSIPEYHKDLRDLYPDSESSGNEKDTSSPDKSSMTAPNKYMDLFNKSHRAEADILLKPLQNTSEDEINAARKFAMFENKDEDLRQRLNKRISSWYDTIYGTNPVKRDASGRQIEPQAMFSDAVGGKPMTKDGMDLALGLKRLSEKMAQIDADDTPEDGISALQKNLNALGSDPQLKVDKVLGPKTSLNTRMFLAENGYDKLENAFKNKLYAKSSIN